MLPVPVPAGAFGGNVIAQVLTEFQLLPDVGVEDRRKRPAHGRGLGIIPSIFSKRVVARTGEARIESSGGPPPAPLELFPELR